MRFHLIATAVILFSQLASTAEAVPVTDAVYNYANIFNGVSAGAIPLSPTNASGPCWSVTQSIAPDPTVSSSSSGGGDQVCQTYSRIDYFFELVGPSPSPVPVTLTGTLVAIASGQNAGGSAQIELWNGGDFIRIDRIACGLESGGVLEPGTFCGSTNVNYIVDLTPGIIYRVRIDAETADFVGGSSFSSVDPSIFVDPFFAGADQYTIVVSNGVGNPSPGAVSDVPEPVSLGLLGAGLVGMTLARRRKTS